MRNKNIKNKRIKKKTLNKTPKSFNSIKRSDSPISLN